MKRLFFILLLAMATLGYSAVSEHEKKLIDAWIVANNLNRYGDHPDQMYSGGTPLYNEDTGETIDRYEYIVAHHPTKPWVQTIKEDV